MNLPLPPPLDVYFAADASADAQALAHCFLPDATVIDEGRETTGLEAIKAWMRESKSKYRYAAEPLSWSREGHKVTVPVRLEGDFPGSPLEVAFNFALSNEKIASLEIG